jgi:periplasmic divalent cation tolerance protein
MAEDILLALSTFPDAATARRIARDLVELRLAACGNVLPQIHSVYRWQGKVESTEEALAIFKLSANRYPEFEARLRSLHPYDVPEIVACPVDKALPEYLRWVIDSSASENLTA